MRGKLISPWPRRRSVAKPWGEAARPPTSPARPQPRRPLEQALSARAPPVIARLSTPAPLSATPGPDQDAGLAGPTPRLCLMMARLEEAEHGVGPGSREWVDRGGSPRRDA